MKALSMWQPWASALIAGTKRYETRSWPCPPSLIKEPLAIHAAARKPRLSEIGEEFEEVCPQVTGHAWSDLPLGKVLGIVRPLFVYPTEHLVHSDGEPTLFGAGLALCDDEVSELEFMLGDYEPGRFAWRVEVLERFEEPIPAKGMQGIWHWAAPAKEVRG